MRVYIAGPISNGENNSMGYQAVVDNIRNAILIGGRVADMGCSPMVPHLTHFWNLMDPRPYQDWLRIDDEWVLVSDVVLRISGNSAGADREVALALSHGIPVVYTLEDLHALYKSWQEGYAGPFTGAGSRKDRQQGRPQLLPDGARVQPSETGRVCGS